MGMPRRARVDWDAVRTAAPLDLILVRDLVALGVPKSTIAHRCRKDGGPWWRPLSGLVALTRGTLTRRQRLAAALLYAGDDALVTGLAACRLHGIARVPDHDLVHVLVRHRTRRRSQGFVLTERTGRMPDDQRELEGVRCAPVARAVVDGARRLEDIDDVRALLADALQRRLTTVERLREETRECSSRGVALVRTVLTELEDGIRSAAEAWCREVVREMVGFPAVEWNVDLELPDGTFVARADGFVAEVALVIEVQSFSHHADPDAYDATMRRHARMVAVGLVVVPVTPRQLQRDPEQVRRNLWAALEQARVRPRPDLIATPTALADSAAA